MKKYLVLLVIREIQIGTISYYHVAMCDWNEQAGNVLCGCRCGLRAAGGSLINLGELI